VNTSFECRADPPLFPDSERLIEALQLALANKHDAYVVESLDEALCCRTRSTAAERADPGDTGAGPEVKHSESGVG
jgi:hypothetical protein